MSRICNIDFFNIEKLISPMALKRELPAKSHHLKFVKESRRQINDILSGADQRLLLIVGPCSIHDPAAAKEYGVKLRSLATNVAKSFFIIMRTYFEKPRTALGWKGMLYDPHLNGTNDLATGIRLARKLTLELTEMEVPTATEFLDPLSADFLTDLISWACIGARTTESQIHRQLASGLPMPVAFKNTTSGNINVAVKGVLTATHPHTFLGIDQSGQLSIIKTLGNPHAHIALRGGEQGPNYDLNSIKKSIELLKKNHLPERVIIDCSHDNSDRSHEKQKVIFKDVINNYISGMSEIRGLSLESHLFGGNQKMCEEISQLRYAVSLTDPCLSWEDTEILIQEHAYLLERKMNFSLADIDSAHAKAT